MREGAAPGRWVEARLDFAPDARGRSRLQRALAPYPFHVGRVFHLPERPAGMATLYLQSASGGLYRADRLSLAVTAAPGSAVHLTTQAATLVHDGRGGGAESLTRLHCGASSLVEFLPDPVILLPGAQLTSRLEARLEAGSVLLLAEGFLAHDFTGQGRGFAGLLQEVSVRDCAGRLRLLERAAVPGDPDLLAGPGLLDGHDCCGSFALVLGTADSGLAATLRADARAALASLPLRAGVSVLRQGGGIAARLLAADGQALRDGLRALWAAARTTLYGAPPPARRK